MQHAPDDPSVFDEEDPPRRPNGFETALVALAQCLRFYSRLPVPRLPFEADPHAAPDFQTIPKMLPLAGIIIALPAALVLVGASALGLSAALSAAVAITIHLVLSGAFSEDGLADMVDGFGGGRTVERRLAIMSDSRVGAYGVAAMIMALLIRTLALSDILTLFGAEAAFLALLAAASLSRVAGLMPLVLLPPAKPDGKSASVGRPTLATMSIAISLGVVLGAALLLAAGFSLHNTALALLLPFVAALPIVALSQKMIGGQTGDVAGATQQVADIVVLIALFVP